MGTASGLVGGIRVSSYILLKRLTVENANALAGMTYGFPAITAFLGFTHALSRQFKQKFGVELTGCGIFCHDYTLNAYHDYYVKFIQNRCPPSTLKGKSSDAKSPAPIIEEAKMDMTVSLLLKCDLPLSSNQDNIELYQQSLKQWVYQSRLAGGSVHHLSDIKIIQNSDENKGLMQLKKAVLPSFVLLDASHYLKEHEQYCLEKNIGKNAFDRWTDFFAFKHQANLTDDEVVWERVIPPNKKGWIVPLMLGFKGISKLYSPDEVENLRDTRYPFRFVEAVHGLGEWRSAHRIGDLDGLIWRYECRDEWYLCSQEPPTPDLSAWNDMLGEDDLFSNP